MITTTNFQRAFAELDLQLQELLNSTIQGTKKKFQDDPKFQVFYANFTRTFLELSQAQICDTLEDHFKRIKEERKLNSKDFPASDIACLCRYFASDEVKHLFGVSRQAIEMRAKTGETVYGRIKGRVSLGETFEEINPADAYLQVLNTLVQVVNGIGDVRGLDQMKAAEALLRHFEPQILQKLKDKFLLLDSLGNYIIGTIIPGVNRRIREMLRNMEIQIKGGREAADIEIDLRSLFRELLPSAGDLRDKLKKEGWLKDV